MKRFGGGLGACLLAVFPMIAVISPASAAAGCRVTYTVSDQGGGGFGASVTVINLGDPLNGWNLTFTFPRSGQRVTQGWNATWTQAGQNVTAAASGWNAALGTNASAGLGFNGTWTGSNPVPASFALNGTTCTDTAAPTTPPPGPAAPWNPPAHLAAPLDAVWSHTESTYHHGDLYAFRNYGWDQLVANGGAINYCVRWDSPARVTAAQRDAVAAALQRQYRKWMDAMLDNGQGWDGWPYRQVPVKVVGWAVRDRAQLEWTDDSVDIYVNDIRENAPQCSEPCGRFFHQDGNYRGCPGGAARHYDHSLWLTSGFSGGAGGDWGQRVGAEYFLSSPAAGDMHILLHEIGHTYGLDDFYDWDPTPGQGFIMKAGSATSITEFDKWMLRDWWRHLRSRYGLPG